MGKNLQESRRAVLYGYANLDVDRDRSIFYEYISSYITCVKHKPQFTHVPALSSLWDIFSYAIYKS